MLYVRGDADARRIDDYVQGLTQIGVSGLAHEVIPGGEFSPLEAPDAFVAMLLRFYLLANASAIRRGRSPDSPPMLTKITETR